MLTVVDTPTPTMVVLSSLTQSKGFAYGGKHYLVLNPTQQFCVEDCAIATLGGTIFVYERAHDKTTFKDVVVAPTP